MPLNLKGKNRALVGLGSYIVNTGGRSRTDKTDTATGEANRTARLALCACERAQRGSGGDEFGVARQNVGTKPQPRTACVGGDAMRT